MIEVEKRFSLGNGNEEKLVAGAQFVGETNMTDLYYDDAVFSLTKSDMWLRRRNGRFELKVSMNESREKRIANQYRELEDAGEIALHLKLDPTVPLSDALARAQIVPFAAIGTTRRKYKKDGFVIDIDSTDFGYRTAEIELMVENESELSQASGRIVAYAAALGLQGGAASGKIKEYLRRNNPAHLEALRAANVFSTSTVA